MGVPSEIAEAACAVVGAEVSAGGGSIAVASEGCVLSGAT